MKAIIQQIQDRLDKASDKPIPYDGTLAGLEEYKKFFDGYYQMKKGIKWLLGEVERKDKGIDELRTKGLADRLCVLGLAEAVAILWDAVAEGKYDTRSLVGDTVLAMTEILTDNGINANGTQALGENHG